MKAKKTFDCVEMKRRGAEEVQKTLVGMTPEEEMAYWKNGTEELRQRQKELRADEERSEMKPALERPAY